jgi:hypothetical protein
VAGRRENGLTAIAVTPAARVAAWLATARERAMEPEVILPAPMLLMPPGEGLVCYRGAEEEAGAPDYRGGRALSRSRTSWRRWCWATRRDGDGRRSARGGASARRLPTRP